MKLEFLDREILRLTALLKDYPTNSFFAKEAKELEECGYLRKARNGLTYRLTEKGEQEVGKYHKDKYPLGRGKMLDRRIECAKAVLTMYRAGINVFDTKGDIWFFPTFILRRMGDLSLGASQLIGLLIMENKTFLVYFADKGLKVDMEITAAKRILSLAGASENLAVILMCDNYKDAFYSEVLNFPMDIHAVTCDDMGAKQLKLMCAKDGRQKLLESVFQYNECHNLGDCPMCDGIKNDMPQLYAYDMNLRRINDLYNYAMKAKRRVQLVISSSAAEGFRQKNDYVEIRYFNEEYLWNVFGISPDLHPEGVMQNA